MSLGILTNVFIPLDQPKRTSPKGVKIPLKKLHPRRQHLQGQRYRRNPINTYILIFLLYLPVTKLCDYKPTLLINPKHN